MGPGVIGYAFGREMCRGVKAVSVGLSLALHAGLFPRQLVCNQIKFNWSGPIKSAERQMRSCSDSVSSIVVYLFVLCCISYHSHLLFADTFQSCIMQAMQHPITSGYEGEPPPLVGTSPPAPTSSRQSTTRACAMCVKAKAKCMPHEESQGICQR